MKVIPLCGYINYGSRRHGKIKGLFDPATYGPYLICMSSSPNPYAENVINIDYGDGVSMQYVIGSAKQSYGINYHANYVVITDDDYNVKSTWFVMEEKYVVYGQYVLTLRRDLLNDYDSNIKQATAYIERGYIDDSDPAIFNTEDMTFNQIKKNEILLKDSTSIPWLVAYIATNDSSGTAIDYTISGTGDIPYDYKFTTMSEWDFYEFINEDIELVSDSSNYMVYVRSPGAFVEGYQSSIYGPGFNPPFSPDLFPGYWQEADSYSPHTSRYLDAIGSSLRSINTSEANQNRYIYARSFGNELKKRSGLLDNLSMMVSGINLNGIRSRINTLSHENGKIMWITGTNKFYRISFVPTQSSHELNVSTSSPIYADLNAASTNANALWPVYTNSSNEYTFGVLVKSQIYTLQVKEYKGESTVNASIPGNRYHLDDAPYDMICIPYADGINIYNGGSIYTVTSKNAAITAMTALARKYSGAGYVYDIQLLPYCPARYLIKDSKINISGYSTYDITDANGNIINIIACCTTSTFSFRINYTKNVNDPKIESQTDFVRLNSPNYSGSFDIIPAKNNGISYIEVDCTYKPYSPYIHLCPNLSGLYGQNYGDARGLICGGDFSIPIVTSAWETYQLQNKNYQNMFDRNIEHMDIINRYQLMSDVAGGVANTFSGAMAGAAIGNIIPGLGTTIGAGLGFLGSGAAAAADIIINQNIRQESIELSKDTFAMQLGNIQALPYSLTKVSAFNANNKIFPFIEEFSCTEEEKNVLKQKIRYRSMNAGKIGKINQYLHRTNYGLEIYLKAKPILIPNIDDDSNTYDAIAHELMMGVYYN